MNGALMTRKEVMVELGIGKRKLRTFLECGLLRPVHATIDETGRPMDRAMFQRKQVMEIGGKHVEDVVQA